MDRFWLAPDNLFLTEAAAHRHGTVEPFRRQVNNSGKQRPDALVLRLGLAAYNYDFLRLICHRQDCGRWMVNRIDANIPALLHGHNARAIRHPSDLALALTRLRFFTSLVTEAEGHRRIVPTKDQRNNSFIVRAEAMIQIQDPGHRILLASHLCSKMHQHRPHLVCWGQSTLIKGEDLALAFYDKTAQRKHGRVSPKNVLGTRIECKVMNPERLADEVQKTGIFVGDPGEVVSTLSLDTAYAMIRQNLEKLTGFDRHLGRTGATANKAAELLFLGLGDRVQDPHELDWALELYKVQYAPCAHTFRKVSKHLRTLAVSQVAGTSMHQLPADRSALKWSDIKIEAFEKDFALLCRDLEAPDTPNPDIEDSWAETRFLKTKPLAQGSALSVSATAPWRQTL